MPVSLIIFASASVNTAQLFCSAGSARRGDATGRCWLINSLADGLCCLSSVRFRCCFRSFGTRSIRAARLYRRRRHAALPRPRRFCDDARHDDARGPECCCRRLAGAWLLVWPLDRPARPGQVWADFVHDTDEVVMVVEGQVEFEIAGVTHRPRAGEE